MCVDRNVVSGVRSRVPVLSPHPHQKVVFLECLTEATAAGEAQAAKKKPPKHKNINLKKNKKNCKWIARQARSVSLKRSVSTFHAAASSF